MVKLLEVSVMILFGSESNGLHVLTLEIHLSREEGWDTINRFNPATFLCLSHARTWISNVICRDHFLVFGEWMWEV